MYIRHEWHVIILHSLNQFSKFCLIPIYLIVCLNSFENLLTNILREISVNVFVLFCCFQGGNTAFIFLGNSPSAISRGSGCKVVFYEPKQRLAASEVTAAVKNPFTLKVTVPHCPSKFIRNESM